MISVFFAQSSAAQLSKKNFPPSQVLARPAHDKDTGHKQRKPTVTRQWLILETSFSTACPGMFLLEFPKEAVREKVEITRNSNFRKCQR